MAQQSVTLNPGESKAVSFEATPQEAKTYQVSVNGLTGSFKAIAGPVADLYGVVFAWTGAGFVHIAGATVTLDGLQRITDAGGYFNFLNMKPGTYRLTCQKAGYVPWIVDVGQGLGKIILVEGYNPVNIMLTPLT